MTMLISINGITREATPEEVAEILAAQAAAQHAPSAEAVNAERDRRIARGTTIEVSGYGSIPLQGREKDQTNLLGLMNAAKIRIESGDVTTLRKFRDAENVDHMLTPPQFIELWVKGSAWISDVYEASWDLKDMDPIPADYATNESYWP